ncbi:MAG: hypothetical protein HUK02_01005, partial [Bacteroidaceae bacterium]|nr:hypothetical protein [Bacteroidaceae bacterium]
MKRIFLLSLFAGLALAAGAQITERPRPAEWDALVKGGRFMDRFLPMKGGVQRPGEVWGADSVQRRYVDNGIEDNRRSYWGGNVIRDARGRCHLFVCGWLEDSPRGHMYWGKSTVFHAVADHPEGPYAIVQSLGHGHNPEAYCLDDGRVVVYTIGGYYLGDHLDATEWDYRQFTFDDRGWGVIEGLSNLTFARRRDGSMLMVCR